MIRDLIDQEIKLFANSDLTNFIAKSGSKISQSELKSFILNHERLPLLINNLEKELGASAITRFDIRLIKEAARDFVGMFAINALKYFEVKNGKKN